MPPRYRSLSLLGGVPKAEMKAALDLRATADSELFKLSRVAARKNGKLEGALKAEVEFNTASANNEGIIEKDVGTLIADLKAFAGEVKNVEEALKEQSEKPPDKRRDPGWLGITFACMEKRVGEIIEAKKKRSSSWFKKQTATDKLRNVQQPLIEFCNAFNNQFNEECKKWQMLVGSKDGDEVTEEQIVSVVENIYGEEKEEQDQEQTGEKDKEDEAGEKDKEDEEDGKENEDEEDGKENEDEEDEEITLTAER
jgi:hypothetical protein